MDLTTAKANPFLASFSPLQASHRSSICFDRWAVHGHAGIGLVDMLPGATKYGARSLNPKCFFRYLTAMFGWMLDSFVKDYRELAVFKARDVKDKNEKLLLHEIDVLAQNSTMLLYDLLPDAPVSPPNICEEMLECANNFLMLHVDSAVGNVKHDVVSNAVKSLLQVRRMGSMLYGPLVPNLNLSFHLPTFSTSMRIITDDDDIYGVKYGSLTEFALNLLKVEFDSVESDLMAMKIRTCHCDVGTSLIFFDEFRKDYKEKHTTVRVLVIRKAGEDKWVSMSDSDKAPYVAKADKLKAEYTKRMEAYNSKQAGGLEASGYSNCEEKIDDDVLITCNLTDANV